MSTTQFIFTSNDKEHNQNSFESKYLTAHQKPSLAPGSSHPQSPSLMMDIQQEVCQIKKEVKSLLIIIDKLIPIKELEALNSPALEFEDMYEYECIEDETDDFLEDHKNQTKSQKHTLKELKKIKYNIKKLNQVASEAF